MWQCNVFTASKKLDICILALKAIVVKTNVL